MRDPVQRLEELNKIQSFIDLLNDNNIFLNTNSFTTYKEVVLAGVRQNYKAFQYVTDESKEDRALVLEVVQIDGFTLQYASKQMQDDKAVVLAAVRQNGLALQYASEQMQDDKAVVLAAVEKDARALSCASDALKGDVSVVAKAVNNNIPSLLFAKLNNAQSIVDVVSELPERTFLNYVPEELRDEVLRLMRIKPNKSVVPVVASSGQSGKEDGVYPD